MAERQSTGRKAGAGLGVTALVVGAAGLLSREGSDSSKVDFPNAPDAAVLDAAIPPLPKGISVAGKVRTALKLKPLAEEDAPTSDAGLSKRPFAIPVGEDIDANADEKFARIKRESELCQRIIPQLVSKTFNGYPVELREENVEDDMWAKNVVNVYVKGEDGSEVHLIQINVLPKRVDDEDDEDEVVFHLLNPLQLFTVTKNMKLRDISFSGAIIPAQDSRAMLTYVLTNIGIVMSKNPQTKEEVARLLLEELREIVGGYVSAIQNPEVVPLEEN